jgi:branched-chain amino acid transport system substrate-binding protein
MRACLSYVVSCVIAAVVLAASVSAGSAEDAAAPAAKPIKIGVLTELSGVMGALGSESQDGLLLAIQQNGGRLGGVPVEVISEDTADNPATAISKVKKLVESNNVAMLLGPMSSATAAAIRGYVIEHHIPTFITATVDELAGGDVFIASFASNPDWYLAGYLAGKAGFRKAVAQAPDYNAGRAAIKYTTAGFEAAGGKVLQQFLPRIGTTDFGPFVTQYPSDADVALVLEIGADGIRFIKQYADYGKPLPLYGAMAATDEAVLPAEGKAAIGFVGTGIYFSTIDTPANRAFVKAWSATHKVRPGWHAEAGYATGLMLNQVLAKIGGNAGDHAALLQALHETTVDTPAGSFGFTASNIPVSPRYIAQIQDVDGRIEPKIIGVIPRFTPEPKPIALPADLQLPR